MGKKRKLIYQRIIIMVQDFSPNQTIYLKNLNEKLSKEDTKKALYAIFGQFGKILEIVSFKTNKLRGQAWITFSNISSATNALKTMQGFILFDKSLVIQYAKTKSDLVAKIEGTYTARDNKKQIIPNLQPNKTAVCTSLIPSSINPPNKILFLENLPHASTNEMIKMLFQQFTGFIEVRMIPARPGIGFVDFETEAHALFAKNGLDDFRITPENSLKINFAKK